MLSPPSAGQPSHSLVRVFITGSPLIITDLPLHETSNTNCITCIDTKILFSEFLFFAYRMLARIAELDYTCMMLRLHGRSRLEALYLHWDYGRVHRSCLLHLFVRILLAFELASRSLDPLFEFDFAPIVSASPVRLLEHGSYFSV
jgi:hypothetical protein